MATHSSHSFASPDSPGDTQVVLVLLESSADMGSHWTDLQSYYLPTLLGALQGSNPDIPMRVCWLKTAEAAHQQPTFSSSANPIPPFEFTATAPLSIFSLRRAVEILQSAYRDLSERATRHLIVVAVNPPQDPANFHTQGGHAPEAATRDVVIKILRQEGIRLHMVLALGATSHPRFQVLRDFYRQMLRSQISVEAPVWFQMDPRKFSFLLAARPAVLEGRGGGGPLLAHGATTLTPRSGPVTPTSTAVALPISSPSSLKSGSPRESASATSPSRRSRVKGKEPATTSGPSIDAQGPGLVHYLKQAHGLTKKRNHGAKANKRAAASEPTRASTSSRPILPRLELPSANLHATIRVEPSKNKQVGAETTQPVGASRYPLIAPALPIGGTMSLTLEESHRLVGRRWPWLHPTAVGSFADAAAPHSVADTALHSLVGIGRQVPPFGSQQAAHVGPGFSGGQLASSPSPVSVRSQTRQAPYTPYELGSSPSPPHHVPVASPSPTYHPGIPVEYHAAPVEIHECSSPTYQSPIAHEQHSPIYSGQPHYRGYPYTTSPQNCQASSPLPSPAATATAGIAGAVGMGSSTSAGGDDPDNQPFVVTEEYEALANARWEAVRTGAMQAMPMTPNVLSPVSVSPIAAATTSVGYFAATSPTADSMIGSAPLRQTSGMARHEYDTYAQQQRPPSHDVIHYRQAPGAASDPRQQANYYRPSGGADPSSHSQWYGS